MLVNRKFYPLWSQKDEAFRPICPQGKRQRQGAKTFRRRRVVPVRHARRQEILALGVPFCRQAKAAGYRPVSDHQLEGSAGTAGLGQKAAAGQYRPERRQAGRESGGCRCGTGFL